MRLSENGTPNYGAITLFSEEASLCVLMRGRKRLKLVISSSELVKKPFCCDMVFNNLAYLKIFTLLLFYGFNFAFVLRIYLDIPFCHALLFQKHPHLFLPSTINGLCPNIENFLSGKGCTLIESNVVVVGIIDMFYL